MPMLLWKKTEIKFKKVYSWHFMTAKHTKWNTRHNRLLTQQDPGPGGGLQDSACFWATGCTILYLNGLTLFGLVYAPSLIMVHTPKLSMLLAPQNTMYFTMTDNTDNRVVVEWGINFIPPLNLLYFIWFYWGTKCFFLFWFCDAESCDHSWSDRI